MDSLFLNTLKYDLFIGFGFLIGQNKCGKSAFSSDIFPNSNYSSSKTTALKSDIKFSIDASILLPDFYTEESLVLFLRLAGILSSKPSATFFSQKWISSLKSIVVCSIYHFRVVLTENIALRLLLLFFICFFS